MNNKKKIYISILAIIGSIIAGKLAVIYYDANFNPYALASFCSVNDLVDCDGVAKTATSQFLGIPLAYWGLLFYFAIFVLAFAKDLSEIALFKFLEVFKTPEAYIFCLGLFSFSISMCLAALQIFELHKICVLCFATYFADLAIALVAKDKNMTIWQHFKRSFVDFADAIKEKKYFISFLLLVFAFSGFVTYTTKTMVFAPQAKREKTGSFDNIIKNENTIGSKDAKVIVHEYMDYNCSSCYMMNISLKRAVSELNNVIVYQHNLPLDGECNPLVKNGHKNSCLMARYAIAAGKQGKYWEANDILFNGNYNDEKEILKALKNIPKINLKKLEEDAGSDEVKQELKMEIDKAIVQNIEATPTIIINMEKTVGSVPYYDLQEKLIKLGAAVK